MSHENIEILRRMFETWLRGDFDAVGEFYDPEVEFNPGRLPPGEKTHYIGREGVNEWIRNANDAWVAVTAEPEEWIEVGSDRILAIDRWRFQGRDGIEIEEELPTIFTFRNGLIVRVDGFTNRADALEAAGLSE
jgi:ketosteroid isomerase-like protein